jgi:hypothetical protein
VPEPIAIVSLRCQPLHDAAAQGRRVEELVDQVCYRDDRGGFRVAVLFDVVQEHGITIFGLKLPQTAFDRRPEIDAEPVESFPLLREALAVEEAREADGMIVDSRDLLVPHPLIECRRLEAVRGDEGDLTTSRSRVSLD